MALESKLEKSKMKRKEVEAKKMSQLDQVDQDICDRLASARRKKIESQIQEHQERLKKNFEKQISHKKTLEFVKEKKQKQYEAILNESADKEKFVDRFQSSKKKAYEMIRKYSRDIKSDISKARSTIESEERRQVSYNIFFNLSNLYAGE